MGKMRTGWAFTAEHGFHGSAGKQHVAGYMRGGSVKGGGHGTTPRGPMKGVKQHGPHKGSAPTAHLPPAPSKKPSTGKQHKFAKGGNFKSEDKEPNESQKGFSHEDKEEHEHLEAARGGFIKKAHGGHIKAPQHGPKRSTAHMSHKHGGSATPEHSHFGSSHRLASHGPGVHHSKLGHDDHKHHAPPHKTEGFKKYAMGGPTRPPGMPRSPMLGMKRMRHGPGQRQMPGIPGMAPVATGSLGMGQGTAPKIMKKGGKA